MVNSNINNLFDFSKNPIWFMRQAGRYIEEYNIIKKKFTSFFDMCRDVSAVTEITMMPINKFNFDAGIIFSDILIILEALNIDVEFVPAKGPIVHNKNYDNIFKSKDININYGKLEPVYQSIKEVKSILQTYQKPLIGFSGAPWTVAAYLIEGTITKDLAVVKELAYKDKALMEKIIDVLNELIIEHLSFQIKSGVDLIQIFDTHSNVLDYNLLEKYSVGPIRKICKELKKRHPKTPISYFSKNINYDLKDFFEYIDIISFSSSVRMKKYINILPKKIVFQGNLDPINLLVGGNQMVDEILTIMDDMKEKEFIFNLGHGILPKTPISNVIKCIDVVKSFKSLA